MPKERDSSSIERKIYFYRVDVGNDAMGKPIPFDPTATLSHINTLPFDEKNRYYIAPDEVISCVWVDTTAAPQRIRFGAIRRSGLPHVEAGGKLSPLSIPATSGLVEQSHIVFLKNNIVGAEFNFHGPRVPRLRYYLTERCGGVCPPIDFNPLARPDIYQQLDRLGRVSMFTLRARPAYAQTVSRANQSLGAAFAAATQAGNAEDVEIILRTTRRGTLNGIIDTAKGLLSSGSLREEAKACKVTGYDEVARGSRTVDCLSDQLVVKKHVLKADARGRAVNSEAAYQAILEAYEELEPELLKAAGISV